VLDERSNRDGGMRLGPDHSEHQRTVDQDQQLLGTGRRIGVSEIHELGFEERVQTPGVRVRDFVGGMAAVGQCQLR
jgi:hypothetical protein